MNKSITFVISAVLTAVLLVAVASAEAAPTAPPDSVERALLGLNATEPHNELLPDFGHEVFEKMKNDSKILATYGKIPIIKIESEKRNWLERLEERKVLTSVGFPLRPVPTYFIGQSFSESIGIFTKKWDAGNFPGFWRDAETGASTETLVVNQSILNSSYRVIEKHNLIYTTKPAPLKYLVYAQATKTPPNTNGFYSAVGWFGEKYLLLEGDRLAKIIFEQKAADVKTMHTRESWSLGNGYKIDANSIGVLLRGEEQAWIAFFKDNTILEDKVLPNNSLYSYPETATGAPVFVTYTSNIYRLPQEDVADFKYTWLRSQDTIEIKEGDLFGVMGVISVKNGTIELRNKEPINLTSGTEIHLMGNMGIQVGGSETDLLFYPTMGW